MDTLEKTHPVSAAAFDHLLQESFIEQTLPRPSSINTIVEEIKGKAAKISLAIFGPQRDLKIDNTATFSSLFKQEKYGAGFTKGLSVIWAYLLALDSVENSQRDALREISLRVKSLAQTVLHRLSCGEKNLADIRKEAESIDNLGGYYQRLELTIEPLTNFLAGKSLCCPLVIDPYSGHLVASIQPDFSQHLLETYRKEIEPFLTEKGKANLSMPYNTGMVVAAYKDEIAKLPQQEVKILLNCSVNITFKSPYIVPVRGDNRYALVASILVDSPNINQLRQKLGLNELYSEGRPLRYTFGAVLNSPIEEDNLSLLSKLRQCQDLQSWWPVIDQKIF